MNKFLKFFSLAILSLIFTTGLIYLGIMFRVEEYNLERSLIRNVEKNFTGSKLTIEGFETKLGLTVDFIFQNTVLKDQLGNDLLKAQQVTLKVPLMSMLSAKGINKVLIKNLWLDSNKMKWREILPESRASSKVISKIHLPKFLIENSVSLEVRNILTSDLDSKFSIKKFNVKKMSLNKKSALELVSQVKIPYGNNELFEGEFRYIGEFSLKKLLEADRLDMKGTLLGQNLRIEPQKIKLPNLKSSMKLSLENGNDVNIEMSLDLEGIITGPLNMNWSSIDQNFKAKLSVFPERALNFYRLTSRFSEFNFANVQIPIMINIGKRNNDPWTGVIESQTSKSIIWRFDGEEVSLDYKSFWENGNLSFETFHKGFGGEIVTKLDVTGVLLKPLEDIQINGELLLDNVSLSKKRVTKFLGLSSVFSLLDDALETIPEFKIDIKSKELLVEGEPSKIDGTVISRSNQVAAQLNSIFSLGSKESKESLKFVVSQNRSTTPIKNKYNFQFENFVATSFGNLLPFFISDLKGRLDGEIQYSEINTKPKVVSEGIVRIESNKQSRVESELLTKIISMCGESNITSTNIKSMRVRGTIDKNVFFINDLVAQKSDTGCRFTAKGSAHLMDPNLILSLDLIHNKKKKNYVLRGTDLGDIKIELKNKTEEETL